MMYRKSILKLTLLIAISCTFTGTAWCQYYYKDLVSTDQINRTFRQYKLNKVDKVILKSFQGNVAVTEGFECEQSMNRAASQLLTYTKTADKGESYFTAFYNSIPKLTRTTDSSTEAISSSVYTYDQQNRLTTLNNETHALDQSSSVKEIHYWQYNAGGKPLRMIKVKNGSDSTIVEFKLDEKGNVAEEEEFRKNQSFGKFFYYYDEKNRLTDIVRYNIKAKRLLPDYIFEYEGDDELTVMTVVPSGSTDYQKWYYKYDENGLRLVEFCYDKKQQLLGKIEYDYSFYR